MKKRIIINASFFYILIMLLLACERNENINIDEFDCSECYQEKPDSVLLNASVTINSNNPYVALIIYKGNVEDGTIDYIDTTYIQDYWLVVKVDEYYSVKAKYVSGTDTIYAIDGDHVKLKHTDSNCDEPCYYKSGGHIDVRLRD